MKAHCCIPLYVHQDIMMSQLFFPSIDGTPSIMFQNFDNHSTAHLKDIELAKKKLNFRESLKFYLHTVNPQNSFLDWF